MTTTLICIAIYGIIALTILTIGGIANGKKGRLTSSEKGDIIKTALLWPVILLILAAMSYFEMVEMMAWKTKRARITHHELNNLTLFDAMHKKYGIKPQNIQKTIH